MGFAVLARKPGWDRVVCNGLRHDEVERRIKSYHSTVASLRQVCSCTSGRVVFSMGNVVIDGVAHRHRRWHDRCGFIQFRFVPQNYIRWRIFTAVHMISTPSQHSRFASFTNRFAHRKVNPARFGARCTCIAAPVLPLFDRKCHTCSTL